MKILENVRQGDAAWHEHRAATRNASEASIIMGVSPYKTRSQLMDEKATGITPEIDAATQSRFDEGHRVEALMRAMCEREIGEDLFPVVAVSEDGYLGASFDGVTLMENIIFEAKLANKQKMADVRNGVIPEADFWQLTQQFAVCEDAQQLHYYVGDGTPENTVSMVIERADIIPHFDRLYSTWRQFEQDLANHVPEPKAAPVVAAPQEALPAVSVQVGGALQIVDNLELFGLALHKYVGTIPERPETDLEFANCEAACKTLKKAEGALKAAENNALAQISDVNAMRQTVATLHDLARTTRLATEKLVKAEKENRKRARLIGAQTEIDRYIDDLNAQLDKPWCQRVRPPFADVIKGLSSLDSIKDKLSVALAEAKGNAHEQAQAYQRNRDALKTDEQDWISLFADFQDVGAKSAEDFDALMQLRVTKHKQAEAERLEAERERIRAEEERRARAAAEAERERIRQQEERKAQAAAEADLKNRVQQAIDSASAGIEYGVAQDRRDPQATAPAATAVEQDAALVKDILENGVEIPFGPAQDRSAPGVPAGSNRPTLNLSAINARLAPLSISGAGLSQFGIEPLATEKNSKLYSEYQLALLCHKITEHVAPLSQSQKAERREMEAA